jgi:hypothetical protein
VDQVVTTGQNALWKTFSLALGAEPRDQLVIRGVSGLDHPVQSLSVDDKGRRLIIVSAEPNPRVAALMQVDVQATLPDTHVLVARPVVFDLGVLARRIFPTGAAAEINFKELQQKLERIEKLGEKRKQKYYQKQLERGLHSAVRALSHVPLPALSQIVDVLQQLACLDWKQFFESASEDDPRISFAPLRDIDNMAVDRQHGICPVPLYEFQDRDWELFNTGSRVDDARERLKELGVYQYFFPPADQLALGAVDRGVINRRDIISAVESAPALGHPPGELELVDRVSDVPELLEQLEARKYVAEGEFGYEVTPAGRTERVTVRFRPREGALVKLLNRLSVNIGISPKDFLGPH